VQIGLQYRHDNRSGQSQNLAAATAIGVDQGNRKQPRDRVAVRYIIELLNASLSLHLVCQAAARASWPRESNFTQVPDKACNATYSESFTSISLTSNVFIKGEEKGEKKRAN
jgi:hypothetical protein